jgi:hypothetical protein
MDFLLLLLIDPILRFFYHLGRGVICSVTLGLWAPAPPLGSARGQLLVLIGVTLLFGLFMYVNN